MTPKEKAEELVDKFKSIRVAVMYKNYEYLQYVHDEMDFLASKQCALIAVDEIIEELEATNSTKLGGFFWQEVKQEIEKL